MTAFALVVMVTAPLSGCGQPWQPITQCPAPHEVAAAMSSPDLVLLDSSTTGEMTVPDLILCNYGDQAAAAVDGGLPAVSIFQYRGSFLKVVEEQERVEPRERSRIDSPVEGARAYANQGSTLLIYAFGDGRLDLQYVQPDNSLPLSDDDAKSRLAKLAMLVGLQTQ